MNLLRLKLENNKEALGKGKHLSLQRLSPAAAGLTLIEMHLYVFHGPGRGNPRPPHDKLSPQGLLCPGMGAP